MPSRRSGGVRYWPGWSVDCRSATKAESASCGFPRDWKAREVNRRTFDPLVGEAGPCPLGHQLASMLTFCQMTMIGAVDGRVPPPGQTLRSAPRNSWVRLQDYLA